MTPTNSIETLQQQVNQVKTDLEALKIETNEAFKKTKAEAAADKVKNAKEEITKKLEALRGLTDANSQADIAKLEAMLKTLETSNSELESLKIAVVAPISVTPLEDKTTLPEDDKNKKEEKPEEKKGWFKRQRDGVTSKEEWKEHPLNNIGRIAMWVWAAALVYKWIKRLFGLGKNKETKWEKSDDKKEKTSRWKKALLWAGIWTWWILVWKNRSTIKWWFNKLFGGKETPNEEHSWTWEQSGDLITDNETTIENYLKNPHKWEYDNIAETINQYNENISPSTDTNRKFGQGNIDKGNPWVSIWAMDNSYEKVNNILSEDRVYQEEQINDNAKFSKWLQSIWKKPYYKVLIWLLGAGSNIPLVGRTFQKLKNAKEEDLEKLDFTPDDMANCREIFNKDKAIFDFLSDKKKLLEKKLIEQKLSKINYQKMNKAEYDWLSIEQQNKRIDEIREDKEYMQDIRSYINTKFMNVKIWEASKGLTTIQYDQSTPVENINNAEMSGETQNIKDEVMEEKKTLLKNVDLDEMWERMENKTFDWEWDKEELSDLADTFLDRYIQGDWLDYTQRKFFASWFGHIPELFWSTAFEKERFFKEKWLDISLLKIQTSVKQFKEKLANKTATKKDIDAFKATIDDYFAERTKRENSLMNIEEVKEENGSTWVRIKRFVGGSRTDTIDLCFKWDLKRSTPVSVLLTTLAIWPAGKAMNKLWSAILRIPGGWLFTKGAGVIIKVPGRLIDKSIGKWYDKLIGKRIPYVRDVYYRWDTKLLAKDFWQWRVSVERAKTLCGARSELQLLDKLYGANLFTSEEITFIQNNKILENPELRKILLKKSGGIINNILVSNVDELKNIFNAIDKVKDADLKVVLKNIMINTSNFKKSDVFINESIELQNALTNWGKLKIFKYIGTWNDKIMSLEQFGKFIWENIHKAAKIEKMDKFLEFIYNAKAAGKVKSLEIFTKNALMNRRTIEKTWYNLDNIEKLSLNVWKYEKIANKVKSWVTNMIKDLNGMLKNPKMKSFYSGIKSKISSLTEYSKTVTPESMKAAQEASRLDKFTWFGKLSAEWIAELTKLNVLIKTDQVLLKSLQSAKKVEDVKDVLTKAGIDASKIDESVLMKIAQTKNAKNMESIINYGAEINSISVLKKIIQNPAMKVFGRYLIVIGAVADLAFVGTGFMSDTAEASKIKQYNVARWENKESEAYYDVVAWSAGALAGLWAGLAVFGLVSNPVWWVCLWASWIAYWAKELGDLYYGEIDKFKQNYKDFLAQSIPEIKQRLIAINSWQTWLDSSFQDLWSKVTGNMGTEEKKQLSPKTSADAVKSLIYLEELQKYPYAAADLNDVEVRNNPDLKNLVEQQKSLHDAAVETRYAYIKKNYIDGKPSMVSKEAIEKNQWIQSLDAILAESRICQAVDNDTGYTNKNDVKWYPKYLESDLKTSNPDGFTKLEKMYAENKVHFFQMIASLPYYESMMTQYSIDSENYNKLVANLEFFKKYVNYKLMDVAVSDYPTVIVDKDKIDYDEINNLLSSRALTATALTTTEISSANVEYLTDVQINEKYNVSSNLWQNILYEIANKKLGYLWKNNLADLKNHFREDRKETNWIYFDPKDKDWAINENNWSDNEFATDAELNDKDKIIEMRWYIDDAANSSTTGNMIAWNDTANKEYAKYYVDIINQNLDCRLNPKKYNAQILEYIKTNSNGKYIQLPPDLLILWTKSGISNVGAFVYLRDGNKFDAKSTIKWITPTLISG